MPLGGQRGIGAEWEPKENDGMKSARAFRGPTGIGVGHEQKENARAGSCGSRALCRIRGPQATGGMSKEKARTGLTRTRETDDTEVASMVA